MVQACERLEYTQDHDPLNFDQSPPFPSADMCRGSNIVIRDHKGGSRIL